MEIWFRRKHLSSDELYIIKSRNFVADIFEPRRINLLLRPCSLIKSLSTPLELYSGYDLLYASLPLAYDYQSAATSRADDLPHQHIN